MAVAKKVELKIFTLSGSCRVSTSNVTIDSNDRVILAGLTAPKYLLDSAAVCRVKCWVGLLTSTISIESKLCDGYSISIQQIDWFTMSENSLCPRL
jgi:hypothetical protein